MVEDDGGAGGHPESQSNSDSSEGDSVGVEVVDCEVVVELSPFLLNPITHGPFGLQSSYLSK